MLPLALFGLLALALTLLDAPRSSGSARARGPLRLADAAIPLRLAPRPLVQRSPPRWAGAAIPRLAVLLVLGGWLLAEFAVLSLSKGIVHPYYISAMAPPAAAMVGAGIAAFAGFLRDRDRTRAATALRCGRHGGGTDLDLERAALHAVVHSRARSRRRGRSAHRGAGSPRGLDAQAGRDRLRLPAGGARGRDRRLCRYHLARARRGHLPAGRSPRSDRGRRVRDQPARHAHRPQSRALRRHAPPRPALQRARRRLAHGGAVDLARLPRRPRSAATAAATPCSTAPASRS